MSLITPSPPLTWPACPLAGIDGAPGGWIAAVREGDGAFRWHAALSLAELVGAVGDDAILAVDIPIGLPERVGPRGRAPERLLAPILGQRRASLFPMPCRAAVEAPSYREALAIARAGSEPPRGFSKQAFMIFPKIREVDALLRARPALRMRVFESHPEVAFARLNDGVPLSLSKHARDEAGNRTGLAERRALLAAHDLPVAMLDERYRSGPVRPKADDAIDALCLLGVAARLAVGTAQCFPDPPERDAFALPIAIHA